MTTKTTSDNKKPQFIDNDLHGAYSGVDIHAYINLKSGQIKSININSLVLVSISTHRDKYPVTSCGRVGIKGITKGCIAEGEMILTGEGYKKVEDIKVNDIILSYDIENKLVKDSRCLNTFEQGDQEVFNITLSDGSSMLLTSKHKVFTDSGWKIVEELAEFDRLLIPLDYADDKEINVPDEYIKLLAYCIGDGVLGSYKKGRETRFYLTPGKDDIKIIEDIEKSCDSIGIKYRKTYNNNGCYGIFLRNCEKNTHYQNRKYHPFITWTRTLGLYGCNSHEKFVPEELMNMSRRQIQLFLGRIFGTDGCIKTDLNRKFSPVRFVYTTTSEKLAIQLKMLLAKVGIFSMIRYTTLEKIVPNKKRPEIQHRRGFYSLETGAEYSNRLLKEIGVFGKEEKYINLLDQIDKDPVYSYEDLLSYLRKYNIRKIKKFITCRKKPLEYTRKSRIIEKLTQEESELFLLENKPFSYKKTRWIKIQDIKKQGIKKTFDIEVENTHCLFGKFLSHNSRTIAGTLVFHVGTKNAFQDIIKITPTPLGERMKFADDLPPFDLVITFVNEQGDASYATITGIDILDEGTTYSMDGINVFEQYSFMARSRTPMQSQFEASIAKTSLAVAEEVPPQKGLTSAETQNQNQLSRIQDTFNNLQADLLRVNPQLPIEEFRQPGETVPDSEFDKDFWDLPVSPIFQDLVDSDNARNSG
jgi:hypothetical protein